MKKYLLIGGLGFVGKHLAKYLANKGYIVCLFDLNSPTEDELAFLDYHPNITFIKGDVLNDHDLNNVFIENYDGVFHLASFVGIKNYISDPSGVIITTVEGTKKIAKWCSKKNLHLFFTSTSEVLGKNRNIPWDEEADRVYGSTQIERWSYGSSKGVAEQLIIGLSKTESLKYTITRFFNIYGEGQNPIFLIPKTIHNCLNGVSPLMYDSGNQTRCFTYIHDAIFALDKLMTTKSEGIFNIGSQFEHTIKDVIIKIINLTNNKINFKSVQTDVFYKNKYEDIDRRVPNVKKIFNSIGWKASTNLDDGLVKTIDWSKKNKWWLNLDSSISEYKVKN